MATTFRFLAAIALTGCACSPLDARVSDPGVSIEIAFSDQPRWRRPLWFGAVEREKPWHAIAEQGGTIHVFRLERDGRAGPTSPFLDLSEDVTTRGNEQGLLGVAFHPRFAENRRLFLYYCPAERDVTRLSEFRVAAGDPPRAERESERVLLEIAQPWENHNGGETVFGPDGMLYLGVGDGGSAGDPREHAQDMSSLLGKILRIDVDRADAQAPYAIPRDNPFVGVSGARGEIWALGLRNPWRFAFDEETRAMWVGDVGQNEWEEIAIVTRGENHGWPRKEGFADFRPDGKRGPGELVDPVLVYPRREGQSVTGGFVYHGDAVAALRGRYVFADYQSATVWSVDATRASRTAREPLEKTRIGRCDSVASFGLDAWGELYACSFDGRIYAFVPKPKEE